jgi:hypothetical protein
VSEKVHFENSSILLKPWTKSLCRGIEINHLQEEEMSSKWSLPSMGVLIIALVLTACAPAAAPAGGPAADYKDATYTVEGKPVTLVDGVAEAETAPGSASRTVTRYLGNEAVGDLNGDGMDDVVFLLTQDGGGSGLFYYLVVAQNSEEGYVGTNAMLLGDRIGPKSVSLEDGVIVVSFLERNPGDSFAVPPTLDVSRHFKLADGKLVELSIPE